METQKINQIKQALQLNELDDTKKALLENEIIIELERRSKVGLLLNKLREQRFVSPAMPGSTTTYIITGVEREALVSELVSELTQ